MNASDLSLLISVAIAHIFIAVLLIVAFKIVFRFIATSAEVKSWVWIMVLTIVSVVPVTLLVSDLKLGLSVEQKINKQSVKTGKRIMASTIDEHEQVDNVSSEHNGFSKKHTLPTIEVPNSFQSSLQSLALGLFSIWLIGVLWRIRGLSRSVKNALMIKNRLWVEYDTHLD